MTRFQFFLTCLFAATLHTSYAVGDLLWLKASEKPISGLLKARENGSATWLLKSGNSAEWIEREIGADQIDRIVLTVDVTRLEKLSTNKLEAYRDYAEELVAAKSDPFAQSTAQRLFLICVFHGFEIGDQYLVASAIKNLINIATNENEKTKYKKLARLYLNDYNSFKTEPIPKPLQPNEKDRILALLQALRKNEFPTATQVLNSLKNEPETVPPTLFDSIRLAIKNKSVNLRLKKDIIEWESHLRFKSAVQNRLHSNNKSQLTDFNSGELKFSNVEDVTEFDLLATQFKDFSWQRPTDE